MKRKNKLPSGTYRIRASCYDPDGTRHQKSFSAPTKAEAEEMRDAWLKDHAAGTYDGVRIPSSPLSENIQETAQPG